MRPLKDLSPLDSDQLSIYFIVFLQERERNIDFTRTTRMCEVLFSTGDVVLAIYGAVQFLERTASTNT